MSYPYTDPNVDFNHRVEAFSMLSLPDGEDKGFDPDFSAKMPDVQGYDLDKIAQRDFSRYSGNNLSSCDSISLGIDGNYYLVEFKNQNGSNIDVKALRKKVVDSISLIRYAFSPDESMLDLWRRIKVYVVFPDQDAFLKIARTVSSSGSCDSSPVPKVPLWGLGNLIEAEFVDYIDTLPLSEFKDEVARWPKMRLPA